MIYIKTIGWLLFIVLGALINAPQASMGMISWAVGLIARLFGLKNQALRLKKYSFDQAVSYDQNINTFCLGKPDETISSRVGYLMLQGDAVAFKVGAVIDMLFKLLARQKHHCVTNIEWHKIYPHISKIVRADLEARYYTAQQ